MAELLDKLKELFNGSNSKMSYAQQNRNTNLRESRKTDTSIKNTKASNQVARTQAQTKRKEQEKSFYNPTTYSTGLKGQDKKQTDYNANVALNKLGQQKQEFDKWYTPDKQSLLFNTDGTLKDYSKDIQAIKDSKLSLNYWFDENFNTDEWLKAKEDVKNLENIQKQINFLAEQDAFSKMSKDEANEYFKVKANEDNTITERLGDIVEKNVVGLAGSAVKGGVVLADLLSEYSAGLKESEKEQFLQAGWSEEDFDKLVQSYRDKIDVAKNGSLANVYDKAVEDLSIQAYAGTEGIENFLYQATDTSIAMMGDMVVSLFTGLPPAAVTGTRIGADKTYENLQNGYNVYTSLGNGLLTGALGYLSSKVGFDKLENLAKSKIGQFSLAAIVSQGIAEGAEESVEYALEPIIDKLTLGKEIEYSAGELFMSAALGFTSGIMMGGGANVVPIIKTTRAANQLESDIKNLSELVTSGSVPANELPAINEAIKIGARALNDFKRKSVIGDAVILPSDQVQHTPSSQIEQNLVQFMKPQIDATNQLISTVRNAQYLLDVKGINMNVEQYYNTDKDTRKQIDKVQNYSNELKRNVRFDTTIDGDGYYDDETDQIVINPYGARPMVTTLVHELDHTLEGTGQYEVLEDFAKDYVEETFKGKAITNDQGDVIAQYGEGFDEYIRYLQEQVYAGKSIDYCIKEATAIAMQDNLGSEEFVKRLIKYNNSLANRIYEEIKKIANREQYAKDIEYNFKKAFANKAKAKANNINLSEDEPQFSKGVGINGEKYAIYEDLVISGDDPNQWGKQITDYLNKKLEKKGKILLLTEEGSVLTINEKTAGKMGYLEKFDDEQKRVKAEATGVLEDVIEVSKFKKNKPLLKERKDDFESFDYRTAFFEDSKGDYYKLAISIGKTRLGRTVYNIGAITKRSKPIIGSSTKSGAHGSLLNSSISQNNKKSIKKSYGETLREKDLLAIHNLSSEKLKSAMELGGLVMPSIAVTKDSIPHVGFGDLSIVMDKDTIDPKKKGNKVYARDAWTPTFPRVDYKINENEVGRLLKYLRESSEGIDENIAKSLNNFLNEYKYESSTSNSIQNIVDKAKNNIGLKTIFLKEKGINIEPQYIQEPDKPKYNDYQKQFYDNAINTLGDDLQKYVDNPNFEEFVEKYGYKPMQDFFFGRLTNSGIPIEQAEKRVQNVKSLTKDRFNNFIESLDYYLEAKDEIIKGERKFDTQSVNNQIEDNLNEKEYEQWVRDTFGGIFGKAGVRNDKDIFAKSGNRRSFEALHDDYNAENVLKIMLKDNDKAAGNFANFNTLLASASEEFKSIQDIIKKEGVLSENDELFAGQYEELSDTFNNIRNSYTFKENMSGYEMAIVDNNFIEAGIEAFKKKYTNESVRKVYKDYGFDLSVEDAQELINIINQSKQISTDYFEAKPRRVVASDEWKQIYYPKGTDEALIQQLNDLGVETIEYDPDIKGDRTQKINERAKQYKFSKGESLNSKDTDLESDITDIFNINNKKPKLDDVQKIERTQSKMIENADEWIPNYDILSERYREFDKETFDKALFEILSFGKMKDQTKEELANQLINKYFGGDKATFSEYGGYQRINSLVNDAVAYFGTDAAYRTNKRYMNSIASKVNNILKGFSGLKEGKYEETYQDVERVKAAQKLAKQTQEIERTENEEFYKKLATISNDEKISYWKTLEQNLDLIANGNVEFRQELRDRFELPKFMAQSNYVATLDKYNNILNEIVNDLGIVEGSKESKAVQWVLEKKKENGEEYGPEKAKAEFKYKMKNGKLASENINEAASKLRKAYDDFYNEIEEVRDMIYGDIESQNLLATQELLGKVREAKRNLDMIKEQLSKKPSKELQAGYNKALQEYNKLDQQYRTKILEDASFDSTRRQKMPYRENYAHHVIKRKNLGSQLYEDLFGAKRNVPTKLAGISDFAKPKTGFAGFMMKQKGGEYEADAVAGFAEYLKQASKIVAYDPLIATLRNSVSDLRAVALNTETSRFVEYMTDYINDLANKTNPVDRGLGKLANGGITKAIKTLNNRAKSNAILFNVRSAVVQFANLPSGIGELTKEVGIKNATQDIINGANITISNLFRKDSAEALSPFLNSRYFDVDTGKRGVKATAENIASSMLETGDRISTRIIWNAAYQQALRLNQDNPIMYADDITRRAVAGRGVGEQPMAIKSHFLGLIMPFATETNNAWHNLKQIVGAKKWGALISIIVSSWLMNELYEKLIGDSPLFDPINAIVDGIKIGLEEYEKTGQYDFKGVTTRLAGEVIGANPLGAQIPGLLGLDEQTSEKIFGDQDPSRYGTSNIGLKGIGEVATNIYEEDYFDAVSNFMANYGMPAGGKQAQRTVEALQTYGVLPQYVNGQWITDEAYYTKSGNVGFVNDTPSNDLLDFVKTALFGKWAGKNAQKYLEGDAKGYLRENDSALYKAFANELSSKETYDVIQELNNVESLKDENGKTIANSKSLAARKVLEDAGLFDEYLETIEEGKGDVGKKVRNMTLEEFEEAYKETFGMNTSAKPKEEKKEEKKEEPKKETKQDVKASTNKSSLDIQTVYKELAKDADKTTKGNTNTSKTSKVSKNEEKDTSTKGKKTYTKSQVDKYARAIAKMSGKPEKSYKEINNILEEYVYGKNDIAKQLSNIKKKYMSKGLYDLIKRYLEEHPGVDKSMFGL